MSGNSPVFWILVSAVLLALAGKFCGRKGLLSVVGLAVALLTKDVIRHFCGQVGEWVFVAVFAIPCIAIYVIQRRKRDRDDRHKHHLESGHDHVA